MCSLKNKFYNFPYFNLKSPNLFFFNLKLNRFALHLYNLFKIDSIKKKYYLITNGQRKQKSIGKKFGKKLNLNNVRFLHDRFIYK